MAGVAVTALCTSAEWQAVQVAPNSVTWRTCGTACFLKVTVSRCFTPAVSWQRTAQ